MKTKTDMDARILATIDPVADDLGYRIVRVRVMAGQRPKLQIMAERISDGRMNVDDCAALSRAAASALQVEDPIHEGYILEVSSPGLERPLTSLEDFQTYQGQLVRLQLDRFIDGRKRFRGHLAGVDLENGVIALKLDEEDKTASIPFDGLSEAKLLITDEMIAASAKAGGKNSSKQANTNRKNG